MTRPDTPPGRPNFGPDSGPPSEPGPPPTLPGGALWGDTDIGAPHNGPAMMFLKKAAHELSPAEIQANQFYGTSHGDPI